MSKVTLPEGPHSPSQAVSFYFDKGNDNCPFSAALIAFELNAILIQRDSLYLCLNLLSLLSRRGFPSISFCHFFTFIFFSWLVSSIQVWSPQQLNYDLPPHIGAHPILHFAYP